MTATIVESLLKAYARVARPIMREFMPRSSCIASARTTIEVMRRLQLKAVEIPVSFVFQVDAKHYARIAGFSRTERKQMAAKAANWRDDIPADGGWNGHLLVMVEDRWVIDPSIDQGHSEEFGVEIASEMLVIDTIGHEWTAHKDFEMRLGLRLDNGDEAKVYYRKIHKRNYLDSDAWNDIGLPLLAQHIASQVEMQLDKEADI